MFLALAALSVASLHARDYYFDAYRGSDEADGSEKAPLRSITRANDLSLDPGDRLLFRAGQIFHGNLVIADPSHGTKDAPLVVGSTSEGRAVIDAGAGTGIWVRNAGGIEIRDLTVIGGGASRNVGTGVRVENTLSGGVSLDAVRILRVTCSGFGGYPEAVWNGYGGPSNFGEGFFVGGRPGDRSKSGYRDVLIEDCEAFDNQYYGILVSGAWNPTIDVFANHDVRVLHCLAHHNPGDPKYRANHSGDGILLEEVDGGVIERCQAWENGALCASSVGGPVGIWAATANHIAIRDCAAFANRTASLDGDGFDFDGGVSNSVIERCTSHDNDGAGILLYSYAGAPHYFGGNVVRNNLSSNDGKKNGMAGIAIGRNGGRFEGVDVFDNIVVASAKAGCERAVSVFGVEAREIHFHDNLIVARDGAHLIEAISQPGISFFANSYWSGPNPFTIVFDGHEYGNVADLQNGTGQEWSGNSEVEMEALAKVQADQFAAWLEGALAKALIVNPDPTTAPAVAPPKAEATLAAKRSEEEKPPTWMQMLGILLPTPLPQ
ncbi:MAG TPA: right-handed parallel beta-helix repeat-containing protein [Chthoniobacteraceae bacterium]|jgi:hypothetical protein